MNRKQNLELFAKTPVRKAVLLQIVPAVASQMVTLVYNLADTYFVGMLNAPHETAAVTVAYPSFLMLTAISNLFGVGGASAIARALGRQDEEGARRIAAVSLAGGLLGSAAGYYGGKVDNIIMRIIDTIMCLPPMLFSLSIVAALGAGMRNLIIAVSVTMTPYFTRVVRASILTVVGSDYVEAARSCGAGDARIILRHIIPNAIGPVIVQATMSVSFMIMLAAGLSFIGLGVQPPMPEWGAMLSEGREYMRYSAYIVAFPGLAIVLSALSLNLLGDGLRDALDPRLKN